MRAKILVPALLICMPLRAGEPTPTETAIEQLRSPDPAVRATGSAAIDRELRRKLAPLLAALKDRDPEVRRRVSAAILGLVPHHDRAAPAAPWLGQWIRKAPPVAGINVVIVRHLSQLGRLGASAGLTTLGNVTTLRVTRVRANTAAARAGLKVNDLIVSVNGVPIRDHQALPRALAANAQARNPWTGVRLKVRRGAGAIKIKLP